MEIQIKDGAPDISQDLVLYIHFSSYPGNGISKIRHSFFSTICEKITENNRFENPILYCRGRRQEEWQDALAWIVFFTRINGAGATLMEAYRHCLERWFRKAEYRARRLAFSIRICVQVRYKGQWKDIREPENWLSISTTANGEQLPKMVLKRMEEETRYTLLAENNANRCGS